MTGYKTVTPDYDRSKLATDVKIIMEQDKVLDGMLLTIGRANTTGARSIFVKKGSKI